MKKYTLKGIDPPGTVDLYKVGKVNLEDLPEEKLDELYQQGNPYLELITGDYQKVISKKPPITTKKTPIRASHLKPR